MVHNAGPELSEVGEQKRCALRREFLVGGDFEIGLPLAGKDMRHWNELPGAHTFDLTKRLTETESGRDALLRRGVDALNDAALDLVMSDQRRDIIRDQA